MINNHDTKLQNRPEDKTSSATDKLTLVPYPAAQNRISSEGLEQNLAGFVTNGGPILEEKDGVIMSSVATRNRRKAYSGRETVALLTEEGPKQVSIGYLNEKLAYFYSHGGPVMEL